MYSEFQNRYEAYKMGKISIQHYYIVESVYNWHPRYNVRNPKDLVVADYVAYGIGFFALLIEDTNAIIKANVEVNQAEDRVKEAQKEVEQMKQKQEKVVERVLAGAETLARMMYKGKDRVAKVYGF